MRLFFFFVVGCTLILNQNLFAQNAASPYLFPDFVNATVLQKNGTRMQAMMNYQKVTEEMLFLQNGKKIVLGNPEVIDTVFIGKRKFVPARAVFVEKLTNTPVSLYVSYKSKLSSPLAKSDNNRVDNGNNRKTASELDVYDLNYPAGYEVKDQEIFWINHGLDYLPVSDIKKIAKAFPKKSESLNEYVQTHKLSLSNKQDLIRLVTFLSE